jgi:hypothetical protein
VQELEALLDEWGSPRPERPERSRVPSGGEVEAVELWLDALYRRVAAALDVEQRLPDLEREVARLEALAQGDDG